MNESHNPQYRWDTELDVVSVACSCPQGWTFRVQMFDDSDWAAKSAHAKCEREHHEHSKQALARAVMVPA